MDSIEKEMIEYNNEYHEIQNSLNYFIGMAENAIELLSIYKKDILINNDSIGHLFNYKLYKECKLDNPFTFIKTNKMYDIANYIKYRFLTNTINYDELESICNYTNNEYETVFLFSNLLYPNVYFDLVKNILVNNEEENKLTPIIKTINNYKRLLNYIREIYKNVNNIKLITWLCE